MQALLSGARQGNLQSLGELLQRYRNYLMLLAATQIEKRWQSRISPSDIVQETMLKAHRHFAQFHGQSEQEFLAWLRQILLSNLATFVEQHMLAAKRDMRREVPIERSHAVGEDTVRMGPLLRAAGETPSACVQQREEAVMLADRLAQLPPLYREVLVLRNIQGLSFEQVAARLDRSLGATRMLWLRAIEKLRGVYRREEHGR
jgi:RNA polymerase sigma-70 factor (ECF subfamily)